MSDITDADFEEFLTTYETALAEFDAETSAALWGIPGTMITDNFVGSLDSRDLMAQGLSQAYPLYRTLGLNRVTHTLLERTDLTARMSRIRVRWHFYDDHEHLVDGDYEYVVRHDDDGMRIYVAVAIDEAENLAELAARKGIDMTRIGLRAPLSGVVTREVNRSPAPPVSDRWRRPD